MFITSNVYVRTYLLSFMLSHVDISINLFAHQLDVEWMDMFSLDPAPRPGK